MNFSKNLEFQNFEPRPLEDACLLIENGSLNQIFPALDKYWVEKRCFLKYEAPILVDFDGKCIIGAKERWLELVKFILDDLTWLLLLPSYKFWSNVIYNSSIIDSIVIFLQEAPTPYTLKKFPDDDDIKEHFDNVRKCVLFILARLITNKESPLEYIGSAKHAHLLYNKYIFTITILMDICQQYSRDNKKIVKKIINNVFTLQPLYKKDLEKAVEFITQALGSVERRFEDCPINQTGKAVPLSDRGGANMEISLSDLEDIILYSIDTISTVSLFIDVYSPAATSFNKECFLLRIISMYSNIVPEMYKRLDTLAFRNGAVEKYLELKHFLDIMRIDILNIYRKIIYTRIQEVSNNKKVISSTEMGCMVESFLTNLMSILSEKEFIIDYYNLYPIMDDFQILAQLYPDIDSLKCEFIINSIFTFFDEPIQFTNFDTVAKNSQFLSDYEHTSTNAKLIVSTNEMLDSNTDSEIDLIPLIMEVKDIFCHLGEGFIERCLKYYNYNAELVINAILENSLPTELKILDHTLPIIPPDSEEASAAFDVAIGVQRLNIYDNDEFDIMTKNSVDMSKIHRGKRRDEYKSLNELLNDKSYLGTTKDIYNKYSIVSDDYDDEYDDTYDDSNITGSNNQDDMVETDARSCTMPRILRKYESNNLEKIERKDEFEDVVHTREDKDNISHDPALLRVRTEERRAHTQRARTFDSQKEPFFGNLTGQREAKELSDHRNKKNKQKSSKANHNRRSGAQWKRSQGMLPS